MSLASRSSTISLDLRLTSHQQLCQYELQIALSDPSSQAQLCSASFRAATAACQAVICSDADRRSKLIRQGLFAPVNPKKTHPDDRYSNRYFVATVLRPLLWQQYCPGICCLFGNRLSNSSRYRCYVRKGSHGHKQLSRVCGGFSRQRGRKDNEADSCVFPCSKIARNNIISAAAEVSLIEHAFAKGIR